MLFNVIIIVPNFFFLCCLICDFIEFLEKHAHMEFDHMWSNTKFSKKDYLNFSMALKHRIGGIYDCLSKSRIEELTNKNSKVIQLRKRLIGCRSECPLCLTKCQETPDHADKEHHSDCHLLQGLGNVTMNNHDNTQTIPCIDFCNSSVNTKCGWFYNSWHSNWLKKIRADYAMYTWEDVSEHFTKKESWKYKINLDKNFAKMVLKMFFDNGLQKKIFENKSDLKEADKDKDVLCIDRIDGTEPKTRNKIVNKW